MEVQNDCHMYLYISNMYIQQMCCVSTWLWLQWCLENYKTCNTTELKITSILLLYLWMWHHRDVYLFEQLPSSWNNICLSPKTGQYSNMSHQMACEPFFSPLNKAHYIGDQDDPCCVGIDKLHVHPVFSKAFGTRVCVCVMPVVPPTQPTVGLSGLAVAWLR